MSNNRHIPHWQEAGVVSTVASPFAPLKPVPVQAVTMRDGFWKTRMNANRTNGIPSFLAWLDVDDQTAPFRAYAAGDKAGIAAGLETLKTNPTGMNRSRNGHSWRANFHKWLEACAYILQSGDDPDTRALLDLFVTGVANAHQDNAFWTIYYGDDFEKSYGLGNPGHLIQAAIAHHRATGSTEFLECAQRVADAICQRPQDENFAGHSVIEMALVELYRTTGIERYLAGARHFLTPLLRQPPIIGSDFRGYISRHVVRQTYLMCAGADYYAETGDQEFMDKLTAIWRDMTTGKLHLTGQLAVDSEKLRTDMQGRLRAAYGCLQVPAVHRFGDVRSDWKRHLELAHAGLDGRCQLRRSDGEDAVQRLPGARICRRRQVPLFVSPLIRR